MSPRSHTKRPTCAPPAGEDRLQRPLMPPRHQRHAPLVQREAQDLGHPAAACSGGLHRPHELLEEAALVGGSGPWHALLEGVHEHLRTRGWVCGGAAFSRQAGVSGKGVDWREDVGGLLDG